MPSDLKRYQTEGHDHFITFSCYRRLPYLVIDTTDPLNLPAVGDQVNIIPDPTQPTARVLVPITQRVFAYFTNNPANLWVEVYLTTDATF